MNSYHCQIQNIFRKFGTIPASLFVYDKNIRIYQRLSGVLRSMKAPETILRELDEQKAGIDLIRRCREDHPKEWNHTETWHCAAGLAETAPSPMIATKKEVTF